MMRTRTDGLRARLARLEKLAGKGECAYCRLFSRHIWIDLDKPHSKNGPNDPSNLVTALCELCGAPSTRDLSGCPEDLREIVQLYATSKLEDTFTDARAWAAQRWGVHRSAAWQQARKVMREMRKLSAAGQPFYERQQRDYAQRQKERERERAREKDPDVKLYNELFAEARALLTRRRKRLEQQYGEHPFQELEARLEAVRGPDYDQLYKGEPYEHNVPFSPMYEIGREAKSWQACAELERIILGDVTATTAGLLADCERRAREVVAAARARHEARGDARRR